MIHKLLIAIYYGLVQFLPNSTFCPICTKFRTIFVYYILNRKFRTGLTSKIENRVYFGNFKNIKLGYGCEINDRVFIQGAIIGNNVLIGPDTVILSKSHLYKDKTVHIADQGESANLPVVISDDVWLGREVKVLPGLTISEGCVLGISSVITKSTNPFGIYAGVPAKLIGYRQ